MLACETVAIFTHSSLLVIESVRAEGMERGERVDVNTHMITHGLFLEAFTQSLYRWNVLEFSNQQMHTVFVCIQTMKLNNVQLV